MSFDLWAVSVLSMWRILIKIGKWLLFVISGTSLNWVLIGTGTAVAAGGFAFVVYQVSQYGTECATYITRFCAYINTYLDTVYLSISDSDLYQTIAYCLDFRSLFYILSTIFVYGLTALTFLFGAFLDAVLSYIVYKLSVGLLRQLNKSISSITSDG